jgi:hypothetical protein
LNAKVLGPERVPEPVEINAALGGMFGYNDFGGPMFRMVWGQTETMRVRGLDGRYTDMLVGHNKPAWLLQRWCSPEMFWTPELYYAMSSDENGLSLTGEYPQFGRYDTLVTFLEQKIVDGELVIETIPLSYQILESLMPVLVSAAEMTSAERAACEDEMEAYENAQKVAMIAERMEEALPAFYNPVSFSGQSNRSGSTMARMIAEKRQRIEAEWKKRRIFERRPTGQQGFFQEQT